MSSHGSNKRQDSGQPCVGPEKGNRSKELTPKFIEGIKPMPNRQTFTDGIVPGLALRVTPAGVKSFALFYRHNGKPRMMTLGRFGDLTLKQARDKARDVRAHAQLGEDPQAEKLEARQAPTIERIMLDYVDGRRANIKESTAKEYGYLISAHVTGTDIGRTAAAELRRPAMRRFLESIAEGRGPVAANRLHQLMTSSFRWAVAEDEVPFNTFDGVRVPRKETAKDRVLSDAEILALFRVLDGNGPPLEGEEEASRPTLARATAPKLMLLLGTRAGETLQMRWTDLDREGKLFGLPCWNIPAADRKTAQPLHVPLPPQAIALLKALEPVTGSKERVLEGASMNNKWMWWPQIRKRVLALGAQHFTLHDLRRTCATRCGDLGASPFVVSRVLGHGKAPDAPAVSGIYNRSLYLRETAAALATWGAYLDDLLSGRETTGRVVPFRTA